ncbi:AAA family ATPase [Undibacterium sp.]|uniref:AAA family ATPase n=1 Tax=Undibacterium sp. TaxID=1914977 RepID=UPI0037506734
MIPRLKSITVSNFRSIRGEITVPLDAPVVLIHGPNGAGKTSILSAIELGLTGSVLSLGRSDANYMNHLINKSSKQGKIELTVEGLDSKARVSEINLREGLTKLDQVLSESQSRFFTERCYLAQATLGRLLEFYQHQDTQKSDSPLTKFVKDLLGLDRLEALIDGLHPTGNVKRLRFVAPSYWAAREQISATEAELSKLVFEKNQLNSTIDDYRKKIQERLSILFPESDFHPKSSADANSKFIDNEELNRLQSIARVRRDLEASSNQWEFMSKNELAYKRSDIEREENENRRLLEAWRFATGQVLDNIHYELKLTFPELPSPSVGDPEVARSIAISAVKTEIERCSDLITRDSNDELRLKDLDQIIEQAKARIGVFDIQMNESAGLTEGFTQLLAQLVPHIHTNDCPVCSRDFGEVSQSSLQSHLSANIALLTDQASRLKVLAKDKTDTAGILTSAEREYPGIFNRKLVPEIRDALKTRRARFIELFQKLDGLQKATSEGVLLQRNASESLRKLSDFRNIDERSTSLRSVVGDIAKLLGQPEIGAAEPLSVVLERLSQHVADQETLLVERQKLRRTGIEEIKGWEMTEKRHSVVNSLTLTITARLETLRAAKTEADRFLELGKSLAQRARESRTAIVRRVFNQDLNKLWRDLFVRLAPDEPFVPAFALPDVSGASVEAVLETIWRAGGKGGDPRAMLSAGNLNTAALTLFLSLHLAVKPVLPWLIIDDPVQSMDEVHISQFAALLRTLSKQQGRQIIIAVHERTLFEYLALELSPAFPEDRLITIELGKAADGTTSVQYEPVIYAQDLAIAA